MLGTPNLVLGGQPLGTPSAMTFRPLRENGHYIWENSSSDQPYHFIAKSTPSEKKSRFSFEIKRQVNRAVVNNNSVPDGNVRAYLVVEYDNVPEINESSGQVWAAIGLLASAGLNDQIRVAAGRGEV